MQISDQMWSYFRFTLRSQETKTQNAEPSRRSTDTYLDTLHLLQQKRGSSIKTASRIRRDYW